MALTKGLLDVLNNEDEPLSKRLRLVKDVFNHADFQISNKAGVLMDWLTNIGLKLDSSDIWETFKECLTSPYMNKLKQNEIRQDLLSHIIVALSKRLKQEELDPNLKSVIFQCAIALLANEIFQQYFKYIPKTYCMFVALVLNASNSPNIMYFVLQELFTFITRMPLTEDFRKYFSKYTLNSIIENLAKYDNKKLFDISEKLVQRVTFSSNLLAFEEYLKNIGNSQKVENQFENSVINLLIKFYDKDNEEAKIAFQLIFTSFCFAYKNQQLLIYKFFICLLKIIGFNIELKFTVNIPESETTWNIERSLLILSEIIHVINIINLPIDLEINNVTISNCIENILSSIISFSLQPNEYILKIIKLVISFDPLIIDNLLAEILSYVMLGKKNEEAVHIYSNLIMSIFDMYIKLHRFDILISEMLKSLKTNLFENIKKEKSIFPFKHKCKKSLTFIENLREIFPQSVIIHFHQCIILLPNKQILAIMKTLLKNLDEFVTNLKDFQNDFKKLLFLQIVTEVTTQFLFAVKIVEHTTPESTVKEFIKYMHNLKDVLSMLGTSLLQMEHNHVLMCCFLNMAYSWAELIILFLYYKPIDDINEKHTLGSDCAASNITYIHNYLTSEHWSILSQRIINFGEQPCKQILQKLIIQKVRAIILFESSVESDVERATIKSLTSDLENNWSLILSEVFILRTIISKLEHQHVLEIATYIIREARKGKLDMLKNTAIYESKKLTLALLYVCLSEMNALFKTKRKANAVKSLKFVSTKVFKQINYKNFIDAEDLNLNSICAMCKDNKIDEQIFEIDKNAFSQLCDIVKILPVLHLSTEIQTTLFVYILNVCLDLKTGGKQHKECFELCEDFLIGMLNVRALINLGLLFPVVDLFEMLLNNLTRYNEIIPAILYRVLDEEKSANSFEEVVNLLVKNLPEKKYLDLAILTLTTINRIRGITLKKEHKKTLQKYKTKLCKYLTKKVLMNTTIQDEKVEPFALVLQKYLTKDKRGRLSVLSKQVEDCLKQCAKGVNPKNAKGCVFLVYLLLTNRKFKPVTKLLNSYSWKICRNELFFGKENYFGYSQAVTILVKHSTYKMFCKILNDVSDLTMKFLKSGQTLQLNNINKLWSLFFISVSDKSKQEAVYLSLSTLLLAGMVYLTDNQDMVFTEAFTSFQAQLVPIKQFSHNPNVLDIYFQTVFVIMSREYDLETLPKVIQLCYKIMDLLMRHANVLIVDRIPTYFILVRLFFNQVCNKSNTELNLNEVQLKTMENCAFLLEKLLRDIRSLKKDVSRVTRYLIADIIQYFEKISLYPTVKLHITNGLYEIIDLCDRCSLSYLLANMSVASAEIFKGIHENYKKYYKYTGKV